MILQVAEIQDMWYGHITYVLRLKYKYALLMIWSLFFLAIIITKFVMIELEFHIKCQQQKMFGLFGTDYRVAMISTLFPTVWVIIIENFD